MATELSSFAELKKAAPNTGGVQAPAPMREKETDAQGRAIGFILNSHWINTDTQPHTASVKIKLLPARRHTVKRYLKPIFEAPLSQNQRFRSGPSTAI
jgi:hypothetical protein